MRVSHCFTVVPKQRWRRKYRQPFDLSVEEFAPLALPAAQRLLAPETPKSPPALSVPAHGQLDAKSVRVGGSELRQTDEVDRKPFTMYRIHFGDHRVVDRRYSQFHELRNQLLATDSEALNRAELEEEAPFPPKVLLGNLAFNVVASRLARLNAWIRMLLRMNFHQPPHPFARSILSFLERGESPVIGTKAPTVSMVDLSGSEFRSEDYQRRNIIVYSFASRYNFQQLTAFLHPTMEEVRTLFADAPLLFVSVADLRIVPAEYRKMVQPFLHSMSARDATHTLQMRHRQHPKKHVNFPFSFFTPDYEGETLAQLHAADANWTFRVIVTANGRIVGSIQSTTKDKTRAFLKAIETALNENPSLQKKGKLSWDLTMRSLDDVKPPQDTKAISAGAVSLEAKNDSVELQVDVAPGGKPQDLGIALRPSRHIPLCLSLSRCDEDGKDQRVFHNVYMETCDAAPVLRMRTTLEQPGSYTMEVKTDATSRFGMVGGAIELQYSLYSSIVDLP